ncbi:MAG: hypothetical protein JWQ69_59 [Pseudomonas sp.]|nr:hypothetical protein [Pseudomonas sp.]
MFNGNKWSFMPTRRYEADPTTAPARNLMTTMRIASRCKYQAAGRLKRLSMFSFYATTLLSLGLIAIPLIMDSHIPPQFPDSVLTMVQIFLAVAVLVFSAVIGTAHYEVRAYLLDKSAHQLKGWAREIETLGPNALGRDLKAYVALYFELTKDTENHSPADYRAAIFSMPDKFEFHGPVKPFYWAGTLFLFSLSYVVPVFFILCELFFITDMLDLTHIIPMSLHIAQCPVLP